MAAGRGTTTLLASAALLLLALLAGVSALPSEDATKIGGAENFASRTTRLIHQ